MYIHQVKVKGNFKSTDTKTLIAPIFEKGSLISFPCHFLPSSPPLRKRNSISSTVLILGCQGQTCFSILNEHHFFPSSYLLAL